MSRDKTQDRTIVEALEAEAEFTRLETAVLDWGMARGILAHSDAKAQFLKTVEEIGEVAEGLAKGNNLLIRDGIGDVLVTLTFVAYHSNLDLTECMRHAHNEIKDRTGHLTPEGIFVKDEEKPDKNPDKKLGDYNTPTPHSIPAK